MKDAGAGYNRRSLFIISAMALFTAAIAFTLRIGGSGDIKADLFDPIDPSRSGLLIAQALAAPFEGFAYSLLIVSPLLDIIGAKRAILGAALCFLIGPALVIAAPFLAADMEMFTILLVGMTLMGVGWGLTEASINPMISVLYPDDKTHEMNVLHAWWPGGIIIGGLTSLLVFNFLELDWRIGMALICIPAVIFGAWALRLEFPKSESHALGVGFVEMLGEIFRRPSIFIWLAVMFMTAATELAPGTWVDIALSETVGMPGVVVLVYVASIMFVMRHFAGTFAHRLQDTGLLWFSSIMAAIGLYLLSVADSPMTALVAATVWAFGVCYMWPTMLAAVAERYPRGGAWTIGLLGFAGAMAIKLVVPRLGAIYDEAKLEAAGGEEAFAQLQPGPELSEVLAFAAKTSFQSIVIIPILLIAIFAVLWIFERSVKRLGD